MPGDAKGRKAKRAETMKCKNPRAFLHIAWLFPKDSLYLSNKRYEYGDKDKDEEGGSSKA